MLCLVLVAFDASAAPPEAIRLSTAEIQAAFANVVDTARVQDAAGTTATNYWYADGGFENRWANAQGSGVVRGRWEALDDMRCVTIESGLPELVGRRKCGPIYRLGDEFYSTNADGTVHGIHRLAPMSTGSPN